jgi:hypothetical protein
VYAPPPSLPSGDMDSSPANHPNDTKGSHPDDRSFYEFHNAFLLSGNMSLPTDTIASNLENTSTHGLHLTANCDYTTKVRGVNGNILQV